MWYILFLSLEAGCGRLCHPYIIVSSDAMINVLVSLFTCSGEIGIGVGEWRIGEWENGGMGMGE